MLVEREGGPPILLSKRVSEQRSRLGASANSFSGIASSLLRYDTPYTSPEVASHPPTAFPRIRIDQSEVIS